MSPGDEHTIHVCTSCRFRDGVALYGQPISGTHLLDELTTKARALPQVRAIGFECLSACDRPCSIAFSAPGKFTYVFGGLDPVLSAAQVLETAALYVRSADGSMRRADRAPMLQASIVARVPPSCD